MSAASQGCVFPAFRNNGLTGRSGEKRSDEAGPSCSSRGTSGVYAPAAIGDPTPRSWRGELSSAPPDAAPLPPPRSGPGFAPARLSPALPQTAGASLLSAGCRGGSQGPRYRGPLGAASRTQAAPSRGQRRRTRVSSSGADVSRSDLRETAVETPRRVAGSCEHEGGWFTRI